MNILIDIGHPANVHYFKHFAWVMEKKGHHVFFTTIEKEFEPYLLKAYGFPFKKLGNHKKTVSGKILGLIIYNIRLLIYCLKVKPDIILAAGSISAAQVAFLLRKPFIQLEDTGNMEQIRLYRPFSRLILTPDVFSLNLGKKQFRYKGYQELCYLHPNYFKPDQKILDDLGLEPDKKYFVLRFISWQATHDSGIKGFSVEEKYDLVRELSAYGIVLISSEKPLPQELEQYKLKIPPEKLHDILASADLYIGEGGTTATECALLGVPNILINPMAKHIGNHIELQNKYQLQFYFDNLQEAMPKIKAILNNENNLKTMKVQRDRLLKDKIDVTAFLVWLVENYPESVREIMQHPDYQDKFK
jgi:uncharacterized protein